MGIDIVIPNIHSKYILFIGIGLTRNFKFTSQTTIWGGMKNDIHMDHK